MTTPEGGSDPAVQSIVELKRHLIDLKLEALLRPGRTRPTSIHDLDGIVDEVVAGLDERRARPPISDDVAPTPQAQEELPAPSNR